MLKSLVFSNVLFAVVLLLIESEAQTPTTTTDSNTTTTTIGTDNCGTCSDKQEKCWNKCKKEGVGEKDINGNCTWKCPGKELEECKACKICQENSKECKACLACFGPSWTSPMLEKCVRSNDCRKCTKDCP